MGKKSKPTVSIITVNQIKRKDTILILNDLIKDQTYKNIIQWVIVEGSKTLEDSIENEKNIEILKSLSAIPITYIPAYTVDQDGNKIFNAMPLGQLRNTGNNACTGDITVCMDDDDYYPPTRVAHCVQMLTGSSALIAGCSAKFLYDYCLKRLFTFKPFAPYHSTNDCMAWKKEYLLENSHDPTVHMAEEASFTKKFSNKMVQLDPKMCIVGSSHTFNTFNKKEICIQTCIGIYPQAIPDEYPVEELIPQKYLDRYNALYTIDKDSEYDIVYMTGGTSIDWNPNDQSLGGSEQAVVNLAKEWVRLGKRVAVYGRIDDCVVDGVDYFNWKKFEWQHRYSTVVLWRLSGINTCLQFPIKAKKLCVDFHDNTYGYRFDYHKYSHKIDLYFFKSDYHLECYEQQNKVVLDRNKVVIVHNGVRVEQFNKQPSGVVRNPYRFCYCSCYGRGLFEILAYIWPHIHRNEPRAELHCYYGMNAIPDPNFKQRMTFLLGQPGVMDHGRRPMEEIIREKWTSSFHLYITTADAEIDCISVRESLVTGCIPLLSKTGVFSKRDGIHFDYDFDKNVPENYLKIINGILSLLGNPMLVEMARERLSASPTIESWNSVAQKWIQSFDK